MEIILKSHRYSYINIFKIKPLHITIKLIINLENVLNLDSIIKEMPKELFNDEIVELIANRTHYVVPKLIFHPGYMIDFMDLIPHEFLTFKILKIFINKYDAALIPQLVKKIPLNLLTFGVVELLVKKYNWCNHYLKELAESIPSSVLSDEIIETFIENMEYFDKDIVKLLYSKRMNL